jgi:polyisoprenoid-binding protein YceI
MASKVVFLASAMSAVAFINQGIAGDKYTIDPEHVYIQCSIQHHPWAKYLGALHDIKGTIFFDRDNVSASSVRAEIVATSIDTSNKERDNELHFSGFLNGFKFPVITYESTRIERTGNSTGTIIGDLTMAGVTRSVPLNVHFNGEANSFFDSRPRVGFSATGMLNTNDFNMTTLPSLKTGPEVNFMIEVEAPKD